MHSGHHEPTAEDFQKAFICLGELQKIRAKISQREQELEQQNLDPYKDDRLHDLRVKEARLMLENRDLEEVINPALREKRIARAEKAALEYRNNC